MPELAVRPCVDPIAELLLNLVAQSAALDSQGGRARRPYRRRLSGSIAKSRVITN